MTTHTLRWRQEPEESPLPSHIIRSYVTTPAGQLELLVAEPPLSSNGLRKQPIFLLHGGFGSARVWIPWMTYLSQQHGYPCYALSVRGHGASWNPGYWRMYWTSKEIATEDAAAGARY